MECGVLSCARPRAVSATSRVELELRVRVRACARRRTPLLWRVQYLQGRNAREHAVRLGFPGWQRRLGRGK